MSEQTENLRESIEENGLLPVLRSRLQSRKTQLQSRLKQTSAKLSDRSNASVIPNQPLIPRIEILKNAQLNLSQREIPLSGDTPTTSLSTVMDNLRSKSAIASRTPSLIDKALIMARPYQKPLEQPKAELSKEEEKPKAEEQKRYTHSLMR